jgi:23S rRNA pseudouridine1911/1915/1917 synthase
MRLDRFLPRELRATSRTRAQSIIDVSAYSEDGRKMRASERLRAEQRVCLWRPALDEEAPPEPIQIVYEDDELLVVNKPALMTVHPTARHHKHTVIKTLNQLRPEQYLSLIHRLDRETSGVLLLAKDERTDREQKMRLESRSLRAADRAERGLPPEPADKTYLAITHGVPPEGLVDLPLAADPSPIRVKICIAEPGQGLAARTHFTVLGTAGPYALVRCALHTGRQHQIRVHLASLGTTIVGDKLYGTDERLLARAADNELTEEDLAVLELPRHALHAESHRVDRSDGRSQWFHAPLPEDLKHFWLAHGGDARVLPHPEEARQDPPSSLF